MVHRSQLFLKAYFLVLKGSSIRDLHRHAPCWYLAVFWAAPSASEWSVLTVELALEGQAEHDDSGLGFMPDVPVPLEC